MDCRICRREMQRVYGMLSLFNRQAEAYICINRNCAYEGVLRLRMSTETDEGKGRSHQEMLSCPR